MLNEMALVSVERDFFAWPPERRREASGEFCRALERGDILFFPASPLPLSPADLEFLCQQRQSGGPHHKNIAYRTAQDRLTGYAGNEPQQMLGVMRQFSRTALECLATVLEPYRFEPDFASFRGLEEEGRRLKQRARNDLLHVDSFPTRPTFGKRILRFFVNVHPSRVRAWKTGPPFPELARRYAAASGLLGTARPRWQDRLAWPGHKPRPAYDRFMLAFHHWLKANDEFQRLSDHARWEFPPQSAWMCFTDTVSHAVLSGQFALEQTVMVQPECLRTPELDPRRVFETLAAPA